MENTVHVGLYYEPLILDLGQMELLFDTFLYRFDSNRRRNILGSMVSH